MEDYSGELQDYSGFMESMGTGVIVAYLVLMVFYIICYWKIFEKAGKPGWAAIIPIYNIIVMLEIVGKPGWWIILLLIPFVNIIIGIIVTHQLSLSFGQGAGFTIGLILLGIIFVPVLAFGSMEYVGPGGNAGSPDPGSADTATV